MAEGLKPLADISYLPPSRGDYWKALEEAVALDDPLLRMGGVVLTTHIGSATVETRID